MRLIRAVREWNAERREHLFLHVWDSGSGGWKTDSAGLSAGLPSIMQAVTHTRANGKFLAGDFKKRTVQFSQTILKQTGHLTRRETSASGLRKIIIRAFW